MLSSLASVQALGPADFLTLTSNFHTIVITDIPQLKLTAKNEARRFITFLDAACERVISSELESIADRSALYLVRRVQNTPDLSRGSRP